MGYLVSACVENVVIPRERKSSALMAINRLFSDGIRKQKGNGGSWSGGEQKEVWYSWVANPKDTKRGYPTLIEALAAWRYEAHEDEDGNIVIDRFTGEKMGQDALLFTELEDCIEHGGVIFWDGEDGDQWQYVFHHNKLTITTPETNPQWICSNCSGVDSECCDNRDRLCQECQDKKCRNCGKIEDGVEDNSESLCKDCQAMEDAKTAKQCED